MMRPAGRATGDTMTFAVALHDDAMLEAVSDNLTLRVVETRPIHSGSGGNATNSNGVDSNHQMSLWPAAVWL